MIPFRSLRQFLFMGAVLGLVGLPLPAPATALVVQTAPQNPAFTVQRGSAQGFLSFAFAPVVGIDRYVFRIYREQENYGPGWAFTVTSPGQDVGSEGNFSAQLCNNEIICNTLRTGKGMKFTVQGYDSADNAVTTESAKTIVHYSLNPNLSEITVSAPIDTEAAVIRVGFTPRTGNSSTSLRLFHSTDSYATSVQQVNNIAAPGRDVEVPGGVSYKFAYRLNGSTTNESAYISSAWTGLSANSYPVRIRPNAPANVVITTGDRRITANWETPASIPGVTVSGYYIAVSTDKITWTSGHGSGGSSTTVDRLYIYGSERLVNGTPYWVRVWTAGSWGTVQTWQSPTPYIPSWVPGPPENATLEAGDQRLDVTWSAPRDNGGSPVTGYVLQYSSDGSTWTSINVDKASRSYSITGLQNGTSYAVRMLAKNTSGTSAAYGDAGSATPVGVAKPKTLPIADIGTTTATIGLELDAKGNNATPRLTLRELLGNSTEYYGPESTSSTISLTQKLTALTPGYHYEVTSASIVSSINTDGAALTFSTTPNPPSNVSATVTGTTATVAWTRTVTNSPDAPEYDVWAELNGVEVGNRCTSFTLTGSTGINCTITGLSAGRTYVIKATSRSTGANYGNGTSAPTSISATTPAPQTITFSFDTLPKKGVGAVDFDISSYGFSSSGLQVTFSLRVSSSVCLIYNQTILSVRGAGTCTIRATQAGNSRFAAATSVDASFTIAGAQTITFDTSTIGTQTFGGSTLDVTSYASASSGLSIEFSSFTPDTCSLSGSVITYLKAGQCGVLASQGGDENYMAATSVLEWITVTRGTQGTLTLTSTSGTFGTQLTLLTSGGSGNGTLTFAVDSNSQSATATGCTIARNVLTSTSAGKCAVIATKSADNNYNTKTSSSTLITLGKSSQTITFIPIAGSGSLLVGGSVNATARSTSQLTVSISSDTPSKCTVSGTTVSLVEDGVCTLRGTQTGDNNYLVATEATTSFEISPKAIPDTSPIQYTQLVFPNTYKVGDTVALSVEGATYQGQPVAGTYSFIETNPESYTYGTSTLGSDGITRVNVTFHRANAAFNLYAVFTPDDTVNFTQGRTFRAIQVSAKPQEILVSSASVEHGQHASISYSGISSTGQILVDLSPTTAQGQAVNISDQNSHCTVANGTVTRDNPGSCHVQVSAMGDGRFESSMGVNEFTFTKKSQTIGFSNTSKLDELTAENIGDTVDISDIASATSSLTISTSSTTSSICAVSNDELTVVSSGTCVIEVSQSGDSTYATAPTKQYTFIISRLAQNSISLSSQSTTFGTPLILSAAGGSGTGAVSFAVTDGLATGCENRNGSLISSSTGTCLVTVTKDGSATHLPASTTALAVEISRASQTINFSLSALPTQRLGGSGFNLQTYSSATSGGTVSYRSSDVGVCTVTGTAVFLVSTGQCTITASQEGNENYSAASDVSQTFTVSAAEAPSTPSTNPTGSAGNPGATSRITQATPRTPKAGKIRRTIKFAMKAPSGLPLVVRGSSACKASKITKTVTTRTKVRGKIVVKKSNIQTGWLVTFTKKGTCNVTFQNSGNDSYLPLQAKALIKIS